VIIKAISIRQPWAWLIVSGAKGVENRCWSTSHRGPLLIHAAKSCTFAAWCDAWDWIDERLPHVRRIYPPPTYTAIERGGIIGIVDQVGCADDADMEYRPYYSAWAVPGQWHHLYASPRPLSFSPCSGMLGLFTPSVPSVP
jgi:hypothetical protein